MLGRLACSWKTQLKRWLSWKVSDDLSNCAFQLHVSWKSMQSRSFGKPVLENVFSLSSPFGNWKLIFCIAFTKRKGFQNFFKKIHFWSIIIKCMCSKTIIVIDHGYCYRLRLADNEQFVTEFVSDVVEMYRKTDNLSSKIAAGPWYLDQTTSRINRIVNHLVLSGVHLIPGSICRILTRLSKEFNKKIILFGQESSIFETARSIVQKFLAIFRMLVTMFKTTLPNSAHLYPMFRTLWIIKRVLIRLNRWWYWNKHGAVFQSNVAQTWINRL